MMNQKPYGHLKKLIFIITAFSSCFAMQVSESQDETIVGKELLAAAGEGDAEAVYATMLKLQHLQKNRELHLSEICDNEGKTPLMLLVNGEVKKTLHPLMTLMGWDLYRREVLNLKDKEGRSALLHAADRDDVGDALSFARVLCQSKKTDGSPEIEINVTTSTNENALMVVLSRFKRFRRLEEILDGPPIEPLEQLVHLFLENNIDIDHQDTKGRTALMKAAFGIEATKLVMEGNPTISLADVDGQTALGHAASYLEFDTNGATRVINFLLQRGAGIEEMYPLLESKVTTNIFKLFFSLFRDGSDTLYNNRDFFEANFLDQVRQGNEKAVRLLCKNVSKFPEKIMSTALAESVTRGHLKIARVLLDQRIPNRPLLVSGKDFPTDEGLRAAISDDNEEAVNLIAEKEKRGLNLPDSDGKTHLIYAVEQQKFKATDALLAQGAYIMIPDKDGENAVMKLLAYASRKLEGMETGSIDVQSIDYSYAIEEAIEPLRASLVQLDNRMTSRVQLNNRMTINVNYLPVVELLCKKTKHGKTAYNFATHPKIKKELRKIIQSKLCAAFEQVSGKQSSTRGSNLQAMKLLIKTYRGILDSDTTDEDEQSHLLQRVFIEGAARGCIPAVWLLLKNNVEIDRQFEIASNKSGPTALIAAAARGHLDMVKLLCYKKADLFLTGALTKEEDSKTALMYVRERLKEGKEGYRSLEKCLLFYAKERVQGENAAQLMEKNAALQKRVRELTGAKKELEEKLRLSIELQQVVMHG